MAITPDTFYEFTYQLALGGHAGLFATSPTSDIKAALFFDEPTYATDATYSDESTEAASGNGYTTGGDSLTGEACTHSGGIVTLDATGNVWTASGNWSQAIQYLVLYNDSESDRLLLSYDYGTSFALLASETLTFTISTNIMTIGPAP